MTDLEVLAAVEKCGGTHHRAFKRNCGLQHSECLVCGKTIPFSGGALAKSSHYRKHLREAEKARTVRSANDRTIIEKETRRPL